mmetsp:Transcript_1260/g.3222  ORF Transcript_1260/g.3222 Transcript_1260/m.3222 type:complete len:103 (-) Transcript_1260:45-353(-)
MSRYLFLCRVGQTMDFFHHVLFLWNHPSTFFAITEMTAHKICQLSRLCTSTRQVDFYKKSLVFAQSTSFCCAFLPILSVRLSLDVVFGFLLCLDGHSGRVVH